MENIKLHIDLPNDCCYYCNRLLLNNKRPFHPRCKMIHSKIERLTARKNELCSILTALKYEEYLITKQED